MLYSNSLFRMWCLIVCKRFICRIRWTQIRPNLKLFWFGTKLVMSNHWIPLESTLCHGETFWTFNFASGQLLSPTWPDARRRRAEAQIDINNHVSIFEISDKKKLRRISIHTHKKSNRHNFCQNENFVKKNTEKIPFLWKAQICNLSFNGQKLRSGGHFELPFSIRYME